MKTPMDAKRFRSCQHTCCSRARQVTAAAHLACIHTPMFQCRLWMLTSLPAYKHDNPNFVVFCDRTTRQSANKVHSEQVTVEPQDYTSEAWHAAVGLDQPEHFKIAGFSPDNMKTAILEFTRTDTHQFCTTGG